ncbi:hypothetical protein [Flectobacillus major]|uniref:hypothetical protein n=1 Tax=Flectobacillus major TaxID=103 RepID=UPI0005C4548B|nr:hypothetical protein [Flectobacillus major]
MGKRIPVEWQGVSILKGEGEYGCIVSGNVVAIGSDNTTLSSDLNAQIQALYNSLNSPGSYTGTFGQAIEELKRLSTLLKDPSQRTQEHLKLLGSVSKASKKGIGDIKSNMLLSYSSIDNLPTDGRLFVSQSESILASLTQLENCVSSEAVESSSKKSAIGSKLKLLKLIDCLDTGGLLDNTTDLANSIETHLRAWTNFQGLLSGSSVECGCPPFNVPLNDWQLSDGYSES